MNETETPTNLFDSRQQSRRINGPLAHRIRPNTLDEFVGQEHLLQSGQPLRVAIEGDVMMSCIFWGPPGCGKTTLAHIIAQYSKAHFEPVNASTTGVPELRKRIANAQERLKIRNQFTIMFLDEIHRFNKGQQDFLLSFVENGTIVLIGATTENPSFEVNAPLLSRMQVYPFPPAGSASCATYSGYGSPRCRTRVWGSIGVELSDTAMDALIRLADGDVRLALNALELAAQTCKPDSQQVRHLDAESIHRAAQKRMLRHDKAGDEHYNLISAFIKSVRGSDADAAVYWLARLLEAGEDARFIARRMVILASEDVGNADPQALLIADAAGARRGICRTARGATQFGSGCHLPRMRTEKQRLLSGSASGAKRCTRKICLSSAAPSTECTHATDAKTRLRKGVPIRSQF